MYAKSVMFIHAGSYVVYLAQVAFKCLCLNFFEISTVEELSQPTKQAKRYYHINILIMKATILDTHGINNNKLSLIFLT